MLKKLFLFILFILLTTTCYAVKETTYNPYTGKLDYIGQNPSSDGTYIIDGKIRPCTTAGIQAVVDEITTTGVIQFKAGTCTLASTVTITDKGIDLVGYNTRIEKATAWTTGPLFAITDNVGYGAKIDGFVFDGNGEVGNCLNINGLYNGKISNSKFVECDGGAADVGLNIDTAASSPVTNCLFDHLYFDGNDINMKSQDSNTQYVTQNTISNSWLLAPSSATGQNLLITEGNWNIINSYLEDDGASATQTSILVNGSGMIKAVNTVFANAAGGNVVDLSASTSTDRSTFIGCTVGALATDFVDHPSIPSVYIDDAGMASIPTELGVGILDPASQFHVYGASAGIRLQRTGANEPFIYLYEEAGTDGGQIRGLIGAGEAGVRFTNPDSGTEYFRISNAGNSSSLNMSINEDLTLGDGSATPTITFDGDGGTDGSLSYDVTTDMIDIDRLSIGAGEMELKSVDSTLVCIGDGACDSLTLTGGANGKYNVFIGYSAGDAVTTGYYNFALGANSLTANTIGNYNLCIGTESCYKMGNGVQADGNLGIGTSSLYEVTSGDENIAVGGNGLRSNSTGICNVGIGGNSGYSSTGSSNIYIGSSAGYYQDSGAENVVIGRNAGRGAANTTYSYDVLIGFEAGYSLTDGSDSNIFIGRKAGYTGSSSQQNICIGYKSCEEISTGDANICIGYDSCGTWLDDESNILAIDNSSSSTPLIYGDFSTDALTINGTISTGNATINEDLTLGDGSSTATITFDDDGGTDGTVTYNETNDVFNFNMGIIPAPPAAQTIAATNTIAADACGGLKQITAAGAVTTNTTDTFTAPAAANTGCCMDVCNVGAENITLDNNAHFKSIGGADIVMTADDCTRVCSNGTVWYSTGSLVAN